MSSNGRSLSSRFMAILDGFGGWDVGCGAVPGPGTSSAQVAIATEARRSLAGVGHGLVVSDALPLGPRVRLERVGPGLELVGRRRRREPDLEGQRVHGPGEHLARG